MESTTKQIPIINPSTKISFQFAKKPQICQNFRKNDKPVKLVSNLIQMIFPITSSARQYSIKITPEVAGDNYPLRRKILKTISNEFERYFSPYIIAGYSIFSCSKAQQQQLTFSTSLDEIEYKISIEITKNTIDLTQIRIQSDEFIKVKHFIENLLKSIIGANDKLLRFDNRSFFDYEKITRLQGNAYLMPGFATAAVITERGLYLKVNDKNKFVNGKTALEKLKELRSEYINGDFVQHAKDFFDGKSVLAQYGSYRVYKISSISFDKNVQNVTIPFNDREGKTYSESLLNYYKMQYKIDIKDQTQPLLIHKPEKEGGNVIYLIPELCYLTGMEDEIKEQDGLRRGMISKTKINPNEKMRKIEQIKGLLYNKNKKDNSHKNTKSKIQNLSPNEIREKWGLDFRNFCSIQGRELLAPDIIFRENKIAQVNRGRFRSEALINPVSFERHEWIAVTTRECYETAKSMISNLIKCSHSLKVKIVEPEILSFRVRSSEDLINELRNSSNLRNKKIVLCILDKFSKNYYPSLKNFFYNIIGIPCQCIYSDKKGQILSLYSNVLNQMIVKVRGELYNIILDNHLYKKRTMIIGLNSSKGGKGKTKYIMTSSYNRVCSRFYTQQKIGEDNQEIIEEMIRKALNHFKQKANNPPEIVIIYRQGGNDKQNERLFKDEVPIFKRMFSGEEPCYEKNYKAEICYISVNKKTDLKFFQIKKDGDYANPEIGTVIDSDVITPNFFEFYLQPQFVNQGTATPVQYHCLYDNTNIPLEVLENITYKQTYYYWNWPGPIREPAALKFAEVCETFTTRYLKNEFVNEKLKDTPFYI